MSYNEWVYSYTKLNNKLSKKSPLSNEEIDELLEIIEKTKAFIEEAEYEVIKRQ